jgi:hypothetical protein
VQTTRRTRATSCAQTDRTGQCLVGLSAHFTLAGCAPLDTLCHDQPDRRRAERKRPVHHARSVARVTRSRRSGITLVCTPALDALAARGVLFANHWASAAPCGPSRASLYTGMYLQNHRSALNGTPLDARFTNVALEARAAGYDPVLFGYTDTSLDPRTMAADDPRLRTYESVLPGFRPIVNDPYDAGGVGLAWAAWLAARGRDVPSDPRRLYDPDVSYPGAADHPAAWAPTLFSADETETAFLTEELLAYLGRNGDHPFFVHASYIRPHPPYRNPPGYHDLYSLEDVAPFVAHPTRQAEQAMHPLNDVLLRLPPLAAPEDGSRAPPDPGDLPRHATRGRRPARAPLRLARRVRARQGHARRRHERSRRDGGRSLDLREGGLLGRELLHPSHHQRSPSRRRRPRGASSSPP